MNLKISNIGIIKNANIELNGITLIAGENGTGKSTIGKILYSIVYSILNYNKQYVHKILDEIDKILHEVYINSRKENKEIIDSASNKLQNLRSEIRRLQNHTSDIIDVSNILDEVSAVISNYEVSANLAIQIEIVKQIAYNTQKKTDIFKSSFTKSIISEFNGQLVSKSKNQANVFFADNKHIILETSISNNNTEYTIDIKTFDELFINDVCYIESPLVLDMINLYEDKGSERIKHLAKQLKERMPLDYGIDILHNDIHNISRDITNIIDGSVNYNRENFDFNFEQNGQSYSLKNVAMGVKSLGMLEVLLKNKTINRDTLLIIDEPEVHLHPNWQIEYAKLIIAISKIGCKVIIATHSPFMVQAIYKFSHQSGVDSKYYITEKAEDNLYSVEDCTNNISRIFSRLSEPLSKMVWKE